MIRTGLNAWYGQIIGQIGMLIAVILIIRILPGGHFQLCRVAGTGCRQRRTQNAETPQWPADIGQRPRLLVCALLVVLRSR